jgi:diguanylate cyclase (GGDEF)-like protein
MNRRNWSQILSQPSLVIGLAIGFLAFYAAGLILQPSETYLRLQSNLLYNLPSLVALLLVLNRTRQSVGLKRWGWSCIAVWLFAWQAGDWTYAFYDLGLNREPPFPGIADAFYTLGYAAALVALPLLAYPPRLAKSFRWLFDAMLITTVVGCFEWVLVIEPLLAESGASTFASLLALSYPMWDLALMAIIVGGFFAWHGNLSVQSGALLAAMSSLALTDTLYAIGVIESGYENAGNPLEIGWILTYILIGLAAWRPDRSESARFERRLSLSWLMIPYLLALPLPIVEAVRALSSGEPDILSLGAASVLMMAFLSHMHSSYMTTRALDNERRMARLDSLTSTLNHGGIIEEANVLLSSGPHARLGICMVDVDGLKRLNDEFGHQFGDQALKVIAGRLRRSGGIVGRYGGDEFLVLFEPHNSLDGRSPELLLEEALAGAFIQGGPDVQVPVSASFGIAFYPEEGPDLSTLINVADVAMYAQKRSRRIGAAVPQVRAS